MDALRVERLSKNFGGLQVLTEVSFDVGVGERLAIIGPNGAGKTTLFNLISGELSASGGRIYLFDQNITGMSTHHRVHLGLSRSFQVIRLPFHLTVLDSILLALHGLKPSRYQMFRRSTNYDKLLATAQNQLELANLWEKKDNVVQDLSYGEQRKLGIALSLVLKPKLLLLDEPSTGLDVGEIPTFTNTVRVLTKDTTTIFTAHDLDLVFSLADRVLALYSRSIIAQGTPKEIQADCKVREIYLGLEEVHR